MYAVAHRRQPPDDRLLVVQDERVPQATPAPISRSPLSTPPGTSSSSQCSPPTLFVNSSRSTPPAASMMDRGIVSSADRHRRIVFATAAVVAAVAAAVAGIEAAVATVSALTFRSAGNNPQHTTIITPARNIYAESAARFGNSFSAPPSVFADPPPPDLSTSSPPRAADTPDPDPAPPQYDSAPAPRRSPQSTSTAHKSPISAPAQSPSAQQRTHRRRRPYCWTLGIGP